MKSLITRYGSVLLCAWMIAPAAAAQTQADPDFPAKAKLVRQIYRNASDEPMPTGLYSPYTTPEFSKIIKQFQQYARRKHSDTMCEMFEENHIGIGPAGAPPQLMKQLKITPHGKRIRATFTNAADMKTHVDFDIQCENGKCYLNNIFTAGRNVKRDYQDETQHLRRKNRCIG